MVVVYNPNVEPPTELIPHDGIVDINSKNLDQFLAQQEKWLPQVQQLVEDRIGEDTPENPDLARIKKGIANGGHIIIGFENGIVSTLATFFPFFSKKTGEITAYVINDLCKKKGSYIKSEDIIKVGLKSIPEKYTRILGWVEFDELVNIKNSIEMAKASYDNDKLAELRKQRKKAAKRFRSRIKGYKSFGLRHYTEDRQNWKDSHKYPLDISRKELEIIIG